MLIIKLPVSQEELDLGPLDFAIKRREELAVATKGKAQELMSVFNDGFLAAAKAKAYFKSHLEDLKLQLDALEARVSLDAPAELAKRGLTSTRSPAGSEDQRRSIVACDPEVIKLRKEIINIQHAVSVFDAQTDSCERAFSQAKAVVYDGSVPRGFDAGLRQPQGEQPGFGVTR